MRERSLRPDIRRPTLIAPGALAAAWMWAAVVPVAGADESLTIAGSAWISDAPTALAAGRGWFNRDGDAGPRIGTIHVDSGADALARLLAGDADFALVAPTPFARALLSGAYADDPPMVIGSVALSNRTHHLVANGARGIDRPADLRGRRVGVMPGTSAHFGWHLFSRLHQLDGDAVTRVDMDVRDLPAALVDGRIDAAVLWSPWDQPARAELGPRLREYSMRSLYTVNWLLVTRRSVAITHPEAMDRVVAGYIRAIAALKDDRAEGLRWHADAIGQGVESLLEHADSVIWRMSLDWSVPANLEAQFDWFLDWPEYSGRVRPAPYEYIIDAPLRRVAPAQVRLPDYLACADPGGGCPR